MAASLCLKSCADHSLLSIDSPMYGGKGVVISSLMIFYFLLTFLVFIDTMASRYSRQRDVRTHGGRGNTQTFPRFYRSDKKTFSLPSVPDNEQDGVVMDSQM